MAEKKQQNRKLTENDQSFKEKKEKEGLIDGVPTEDQREEQVEEQKKTKSKDDSSTEELYSEDFRK
ncbi:MULTISPECIES: hypothetical protein [Pontibacillus]|uniref:DUF4025 domain-containing protein n=1 Tax=Pontibacillus chungwhensis TaxID=265426 RepID=A0ABY8USZ4_9BACI|nr:MULTISPECIES: hypothetical protein [Pontibacillus]MCD5323236.1 hypothetical protein [Pontibacillus sp. HN14]WIF96622.1 hypothetical protein QNI29_12765 [Pontibacillus chungwhensis]